jgi:Tfp pilus assembly protein PilO
MTRVSGSRAIVIGVAAAMAMIGFWYQLAWSAQGRAVASAQADQRAASAGLLTAEQRLGHLKHLSVKSGALDVAAAKMAAAIPSQDSLDSFLLEVNGDAAASVVTVSAIGVTQPGPAALTTPIPLQLTVSGGYFAILHFLDLLRDGPRLVVIDRLALAPASVLSHTTPVAGQGTALTATIVGRSFMAKGSAALLPPPTAPTRPPAVGTGVLETPINAARTAAANSTAAANAIDAATGAKP